MMTPAVHGTMGSGMKLGKTPVAVAARSAGAPSAIANGGRRWLPWRRRAVKKSARPKRERIGRIGATLQFLVIAGGLGIGSAWYMIERGGAVSTRQFGPWVTWINALRPDVDPYTQAHLVRRSRLALHGSMLSFEAAVDDDGELLHSACEYSVEGPRIEASWWSLAVFGQNGRLIENKADRYMHSKDTVARGVDGSIAIVMARDARPGNWLPTAGGGQLMLVLTVAEDSVDRSGATLRLPSIRRVACR